MCIPTTPSKVMLLGQRLHCLGRDYGAELEVRDLHDGNNLWDEPRREVDRELHEKRGTKPTTIEEGALCDGNGDWLQLY